MPDTNAQLSVHAKQGLVYLLEYENDKLTGSHGMKPAAARAIANSLLNAADEADKQLPRYPKK